MPFSLADQATALLCVGQRDRAHELFQLTLQIEPYDRQAHVGLACWLLQGTEEWARGWQELQWTHLGQCTRLCWDGSPLQGRSLSILLDEQASGAGDVFWLARFVPWLKKARGAGHIIVEVPNLSGESLIRRSFPFVTVKVAGQDVARADVHTHLLSLPLWYGAAPDHLPLSPYLTTDSKLVRHWRTRLRRFPNKGLGVGLVWRCQGNNWNSTLRSCRLDDLLPLTTVSGLQLFSLQKDVTDSEKATLEHQGIADLSSELKTWDDTAACMTALDGIVSVDTGPLHLAGALGRPTWALLPFVADWRYGLAESTPWYPPMRLCRQPWPGAWGAVVAGVVADLQAMGNP